MARGSLSLLSILLVAGTAFIVEQNTFSLGAYRDRLPGSTTGGAVIGVAGMMSLVSMMFTG